MLRAVLLAATITLWPVVAAADGPLTRPQLACVIGMNAAGARVATAAANEFIHCLHDAAHGRLPAGLTADQCVRADSRGRIARARTRTSAIFTRKCRTPPPFGPPGPDAVNDAFAQFLRVESVFGPSLDTALIRASSSKAGASCQMAVGRAMTRVALAKLEAFHACTAKGLERGTITTARDLLACEEVEPKGRVVQVLRAAQTQANRKCARVPVADAFPGACVTTPLRELFGCVERQVDCGVCLAINHADRVGRICNRVAPSCGGDPPDLTKSVARQWIEETLSAIRRDNPRPPVHARNLFHVATAMYDAWAAYDVTARPYLTHERATSTDVERDRSIAISFAAYRVLSERYSRSLALGSDASQESFDVRMAALGYDAGDTSTTQDTPAALGNRIAAAIIAFGQLDGANEVGSYADPTYTAVNGPLVVKLPDIDLDLINDVNHWQPLALDVIIAQNGVPVPGKIQSFVGSQWGNVVPFALAPVAPGALSLDPGPPPRLGAAGDGTFKEQVHDILERSSRLTPDDPTTMDISPAASGNNPLGTNDGHGYGVNPVTGQPYASQLVKVGDYGRLVAEFWTDGPGAETIPGYWNVIAGMVADSPLFERRFAGAGPALNALEWDVKTYFAINAAMHDAAIACWGAKRAYDGVRPLTAIRYMGKKGQSSDPVQASYDPNGLPLAPGLIEIITAESSAPGERHAPLVTTDVGGHVGDIAIRVWPGSPAEPATQYSGVQWHLARGWNPYQRSTFVTPPFPGYLSGDSAFSRSAAEVMAAVTGTPYFPGGLGEYLAPRNAFLKFELGPSTDVRLQWATYYDAADQAGESRLWAGVHVAADDLMGRLQGHLIGVAAFDKARTYFDGTATP